MSLSRQDPAAAQTALEQGERPKLATTESQRTAGDELVALHDECRDSVVAAAAVQAYRARGHKVGGGRAVVRHFLALTYYLHLSEDDARRCFIRR